MSSWSGTHKRPDLFSKSRVITVALQQQEQQQEQEQSLVCSVLRGGIGNRLFQIMAGLGYAERTGKQFVFVEKHISDNFHAGFRSTMDLLMALFPSIKVYRGVGLLWTKYEHKNCRSKDKFYEYEPIPFMNGSVILDGFFQNERYFPEGYRAKFRVPLPPVLNPEFEELIQTVNFEKTYFIHFRLGDYVDSDYDVGLAEYYRASIVRSAATNFLIFSDDVNKLNLSGLIPLGINYTIVPSNIGIWSSLYLMSLCAGGICANSTFSWFGAYACRGSVFMPSVWHKVITGAPIPAFANEVALAYEVTVASVNSSHSPEMIALTSPQTAQETRH